MPTQLIDRLLSEPSPWVIGSTGLASVSKVMLVVFPGPIGSYGVNKIV